jgi:arsenite oxidase large subunit
MAQPRMSAKEANLHALSTYPTGTMGNVVSKGVNELIIPNYKQTWASIRNSRRARGHAPVNLQIPEYVSG